MSNEKFRVKFGVQVGDSAATIDGTTGDIVTAGDATVKDLILTGNDIKSSGGTTAITVSGADATVQGDLIVQGGDLTVAGNGYIYSATGLALSLAGNNATVAGDLTILGNDIKSSTGATAITLVGDDTTVAGDLTLGNNIIKSSDGVSVLLTNTGSAEFLSNVTIDGNTTLGNTNGKTVTFNGQVNNNITFTNNNTTTNRGVTGTVGSDDYWKYGGGSTATDAGYAEIATGDNGTEPIYARQYTSGSVTRTLTLLDATGNTQLAGDLTVNGSGYIYSSAGLALDLTGNDVRVVGDLTVDGGDLVINSTTTNVANTTATTVNFAGAATTVSIGANTGTTTINNSLVADDLSTTTVDTTNIEVTNIKAKDGTAAATIADSTGIITVSSQLNVDNLNFNGNSIASTDTNGNVTVAPNGTGNVALTLANGGNLTNTRNYVQGAIRNSTSAAAGDIYTLGPAGTGYRGISIDNSTDTTKGPTTLLRSYTGGAVNGNTTRSRVTFEKARGTSASPTAVQAFDQLSSIDTTGYTSTGWLSDLIASPSAVQLIAASENWVSNTNLGSQYTLALAPTGTTITSGANLIPVILANPQAMSLRSDTFAIGKGKTAAFTATGSSISGTTLTIGTVVSGTVSVGQLLTGANITSFGVYIVSNISGSGSGSTWTVSQSVTAASSTIVGYAGFVGSAGTYLDSLGDLRLLTNTIRNSGGSNVITMNSGNTTTGINTTQLNITNPTTQTSYNGSANIAFNAGNPAGLTFNDRISQLRMTTATTGAAESSTVTFNTGRYDTGANVFSPTQSGDFLGEFFFAGNYGNTSSFTSLGPSVRFTAKAAENFTSTNSGGRFSIILDKIGGSSTYEGITIDSGFGNFASDVITLEDSSGNDYMVLNNNKILNNRPHRSAVTTHSMARGQTYTPAVGTNNFIELTLTAGTDPTYIDVDNLTVAGEGGHQAILVYNNSGTSIGNGDLIIRNNGTQINDLQNTVANGARVIFTVYCVGNYASCEYMIAA